MNTTANISLEQIIKRRLEHYCNDTTPELLPMNTGYARGFRQMLDDMTMSEEDFLKKYVAILQQLQKQMEPYDGIDVDETVDELCGCNNAIVDVLSLPDIHYFYLL
ncbi:MAG: hypothetical protein IKB13_03465 [Clostridia bacterium]|nr:hypothetical protein [Clostridia bacterium]